MSDPLYTCPFCGQDRTSPNGTGSDIVCCGEVGHCEAGGEVAQMKRETHYIMGKPFTFLSFDAEPTPPCTHDLAQRETACADGYCPLCLADMLSNFRAASSAPARALKVQPLLVAALRQAIQLVEGLRVFGDDNIQRHDAPTWLGRARAALSAVEES